jgi:hypothetical protein
MRWPVAMAMGLALTGGLCGCKGTSCDKVEQELRAREEDVRHLKGELDRAEFYNQALSRELAAVRGEPGPTGHVEKPSEPYPVRSLRLGRGTAGRPADCGGDDALQVQVEPVDCEGQTIKAPGFLHVEAYEVTKEGIKRPLSAWDVPKDLLRYRWQSGLFNTGYMLTFPWKTAPATEKLRVVARFTLVDGRVFEADRDITVRVLPENVRRVIPSLPEPTPAPSHTLPGPTEAPPPKKEAPALPPPTMKPEPKGTPVSTDGPVLTGGRADERAPAVRLLRPVPMPPEEP